MPHDDGSIRAVPFLRPATVLLALPALLGALRVEPLAAQTPDAAPTVEVREAAPGSLAGVVTDDASGEPVVGAEVILVGTGIVSITDAEGRFTVVGLPPGRYPLRVQAGGHRDRETQVEVRPGSGAEVALALETERVVEVAGIEVEVERNRASPLRGFLDRRKSGVGHYIGPEEVAERSKLSDVFRRHGNAFLRVQECPSQTGSAQFGCVTLVGGARSSLTSTLGNQSSPNQHPGPPGPTALDTEAAGPPTQSCEAAIFLDGRKLPAANVGGGIDMIPADAVYGIEIYRNAAVAPPRYAVAGTNCGVVLIWSRTGQFEDEPGVAPGEGSSGSDDGRGSR